MIPDVARTSSIADTLRWLVGPGYEGEQQRPRVVAGSCILERFGWYALDAAAVACMAADLDQARVQLVAEDLTVVPRWEEARLRALGYSRVDAARAARQVINGWHCTLTLPVGDGELGGVQWGRICHQFMQAMGFGVPFFYDDANGDESAEHGDVSAVQWVAIAHGTDRGSRDHVHIVASLVRTDGTVVSAFVDTPVGPMGDARRAQQICADLERRHGLSVVDSRNRRIGPVMRAFWSELIDGLAVPPDRNFQFTPRTSWGAAFGGDAR